MGAKSDRPRRLHIPDAEPSDAIPAYSAADLVRMNDGFRKAMLAAIKRGEECCPTAVSTSAGTRHPIIIRPDI